MNCVIVPLPGISHKTEIASEGFADSRDALENDDSNESNRATKCLKYS